MAVLAGIFGGNAKDTSQDSDKLLDLYWNRAGLKKEFAALRKEQYRLADLVKQHEGAAARLQQKLEYVESLLIDPEWAPNIVAFYQLRGLAQRCERKLEKFAEQLKQQREQKQHNAQLVKWNDERASAARDLQQRIAGVQEKKMMLEGTLQAERNRLVSMSGFVRIFRRRAVTAKLEEIRAEIVATQQAEMELQEKLQQLKERKPPETRGLDTPTKRSVNHLIISYAQQLFLNLGDPDLVSLVKEANDKSAGAVRYGSASDCEHLVKRVQKRLQSLDRNTDVASVLQKRALLIGKKALYRADGDSVPVASSVGTVFDIVGDDRVDETRANLVGENYFGIARFLSR